MGQGNTNEPHEIHDGQIHCILLSSDTDFILLSWRQTFILYPDWPGKDYKVQAGLDMQQSSCLSLLSAGVTGAAPVAHSLTFLLSFETGSPYTNLAVLELTT